MLANSSTESFHEHYMDITTWPGFAISQPARDLCSRALSDNVIGLQGIDSLPEIFQPGLIALRHLA